MWRLERYKGYVAKNRRSGSVANGKVGYIGG